MKPPWQTVSQEGAELEALQTDVMRFVAILGLCLAAIFSLVHGAPPEQSEIQGEAGGQLASVAKKTAAKEAERHLDTSLKPERQSVALAAHLPSGPKDPDAEGFSLEFASPSVFRDLVRSEQIQLYVNRDGAFLRFGLDGVFRAAMAPASYYRMHPDTVPPDLRDALAETGDELVWGVVLPKETAGKIRQMMAKHEGGNLVIRGGGSPGLEVMIEP